MVRLVETAVDSCSGSLHAALIHREHPVLKGMDVAIAFWAQNRENRGSWDSQVRIRNAMQTNETRGWKIWSLSRVVNAPSLFFPLLSFCTC